MKIKTLFMMTIVLAAMTFFAACGGGGGATPQPSKVTVSGVASKGLIDNGTINIYAANNNGTKGNLLATTTTDSFGHYTVEINNYTGPVVVEATGTYTDEATGQTKTIDTAAPLRAALPSLSGSAASIAVTPLTDLAYQKAQTAMANSTDAATAIANANSQVSGLFHVDITSTQPVDPAQTTFQNSTRDQQIYTLALAAVSQMAKDSGTNVDSVIKALNTSGTGAATQVSSALSTYLGTGSNVTGYKNLVVPLALIAGADSQVASLDFAIDLPSGTIVPAGNYGAVDANTFSVSPTGGANTVIAMTKFTAASGNVPAKLRVIILNTNLLSSGQFATLRCTASSTTEISNFTVEDKVIAKDSNGIVIPGVGVAAQ